MATVLGVLLLKEMFALTDAEALEQLEFSLLWQHALELTPDEAHLAQKTRTNNVLTLHNFRARLLAHDGGRQAFEATTDGILQALGTKVTRQRLDSTHVISNIAVLSRLGLLCETLRHFLKTLAAEHPRLYGRVSKRLRERYLKEDANKQRLSRHGLPGRALRHGQEAAAGVRARSVSSPSAVCGHGGRGLGVLRAAAAPAGRAV